MGKNNKLKKKLKRQQTSILPNLTTLNETLRSSKKQKKLGGETVMEIDALSFDDAFSAGLAFEQLESFDGALSSFQRAVSCQPAHLGALTHLADAYSATGQPDEALKCYIKASKLEGGKKDASVWFRLGLTYAALNQQLKATKAYQKSVNINAKALETVNAAAEDVGDLWKAYGITLAALAEAFGEHGDLDLAVKVFEDAVARFPDAANMHYNLANMRMARNKSTGDDAFDAAVVRSLERAIKLSPETCDFVDDLASYLEQHNQQPDQVCALIRKANEFDFARTAAAAASDDELTQKKGTESDGEEDVGKDEKAKEEEKEEHED